VVDGRGHLDSGIALKLIRQLLAWRAAAMTIRIISYLIGLTATLLVAALAGGTAWAAVSPAPISSVHAQVRLVATPADTDCEDDNSKDKGSKDKGSKDKGSKDKGSMDKGSMDKGSMDGIQSFLGPMSCGSKSCGMDPKTGMEKSCGGSNGGNGTKSTAVCDSGFKLMTIDAMLRSVAGPGTARDLKAADVNRDDHLCVKLAADKRSMTRFVDNNRAA
jgi:hypothetical protein